MKGKKPKRSLLQWISERIDAKRPPLIPPPRKSWVEWGALKTAELSVRGTAKTVKAVYYGLTPEQMPDARYESTLALQQQMEEVGLIDIDDAVERIYEQIPKPLTIYRQIIRELVTPELTPPAPPHDEPIAHAKWRDQARRYIDLQHSGRKRLAEPILAIINEISKALPAPSNSKLRIPIVDLLPNVPTLVESAGRTFYRNYPTLQSRLKDNLLDDRGDEVPPTKSKLPVRDIPKAYLKGTPLLTLFTARVPFAVPEMTRFEHTWMLAGTGDGKTTWLAGQLLQDIERIKRGEASAIVIDSQNNEEPGKISLIRQLVRLDVPKIIIDPNDMDNPIALNLFDVGWKEAPTKAEKTALLQNAIKNFKFIVGSLFDQPMTPRQAGLFANIAELLITTKDNATIHDFRNLLDHKRALKYEENWVVASPSVKDYFETEYLTNNDTKATAAQVLTRLRSLLQNDAFLNMFASPTTKLSLVDELNKGKLIVINTDKAFLTSEGTKMFGRFWIAQINQAAIRRGKLLKKLPTYVYIDECQDYLAGGDPNIEEILDQARKQNIGLTLIHHRTGQLKSDSLIDALDSNTSTKIVGSLNIADQGRLPRMMNTDAEFLKTLEPKKTFGIYVKGEGGTKHAVAVAFPNVRLNSELSDEQFSVMLTANRAAYCYQPESTAAHSGTGTKPSSDGKTNSGLSEDY